MHELEAFIYVISGNGDIDCEKDSIFEKLREDWGQNCTVMPTSGERKSAYLYGCYLLNGGELSETIGLCLKAIETKNVKGIYYLRRLLPFMLNNIQMARENANVKRLVGVLAGIFAAFYTDDAYLYDSVTTLDKMKGIVIGNKGHYDECDNKYLLYIFLEGGRFEILVDYLAHGLENGEERDGTLSESLLKVDAEFHSQLSYLKSRNRYEEAERLYNLSGRIYDPLDEAGDIKKSWRAEKGYISFGLKKYEEARDALDRYVITDIETVDALDLYNAAVIYAWAANRKAKRSERWAAYIDKALEYADGADRRLRSEEKGVQGGGL